MEGVSESVPDRFSAVALIPFDPSRHRPRLRPWLRSPHVARRWGDPDRALSFVDRQPPNQHALIAVDNVPIGYMCWQRLDSDELAAAGLGDLPADHIDVDILIGDPDFVGRGIGPQALRLLIQRLQADGVSSVGLATAADNHRALRAFEKAGFCFFRSFREEDQEMCYLRLPTGV